MLTAALVFPSRRDVSGERLGIICPHCGGDTGVTDSRPSGNNTIRRRRRCRGCDLRFTTYEVVAEQNPEEMAEVLRKQAASLRVAADRLEKIAAERDPT